MELSSRDALNKLTHKIIRAADEVDLHLGPGLLLNYGVKLLKDGVRRFIIP